MKIDPHLTIGGMNPQVPAKTTAKKGAFEEVLSGIEQPAKPEATLPPAMMVSPVSPYKLKALSISEQAIEQLDGYAKALADPSRTLKSIEPLVNDLAGLKPGLDEAAGALNDDDPLKGILQDTGATIDSAVLRFARGDLLM